MIQDCLVCNFSLLLGCCLLSHLLFKWSDSMYHNPNYFFLSRISQRIFSSTIEEFGEAICQSVSFRQDF